MINSTVIYGHKVVRSHVQQRDDMSNLEWDFEPSTGCYLNRYNGHRVRPEEMQVYIERSKNMYPGSLEYIGNSGGGGTAVHVQRMKHTTQEKPINKLLLIAKLKRK